MEWRRTVGGVLLAGLLMLIIVGFGLGEVSRHVTNSADLDAVRDLAGDRTRALTSIAEVLSVLGRTVVIIPLAPVLPAATLRSRLLAVTAATVLVAGIAFSRVYLAVHYPTDVAGGIVLGTTWCLLAHRVVCGDWWAMSSHRTS